MSVKESQTPVTIAVLVKYVPDAQLKRRFLEDDAIIDREGGVLSELDEYPLEAALTLAEERGGVKAGNRVLAVTMGPDGAVVALKKALQMGAHEGVHLSDPALVASDVTATSTALAAVVRHVGPVDLVLCGMASSDGETSLVPTQLATKLGLPLMTHATSLSVEADAIRIRRSVEGYTEMLETSMPAVVSVTDRANHPRYPNFAGILAARKRPITTVKLEDVGLSADQVGAQGSKVAVTRVESKPPRKSGVVIMDQGNAGGALVDFLEEHHLLNQ